MHFQEPDHLDKYLASNIFLPDINNEKEPKTKLYADNLAMLDSFIMIRFSNDTVGKKCAWPYFLCFDFSQEIESSLETCQSHCTYCCVFNNGLICHLKQLVRCRHQLIIECGLFAVVPRDSAWFSFYDGKNMIPIREQAIYKEDWIGLKKLDAKGMLLFDECPGNHMQFSWEFFQENVVEKYLIASLHPPKDSLFARMLETGR